MHPEQPFGDPRGTGRPDPTRNLEERHSIGPHRGWIYFHGPRVDGAEAYADEKIPDECAADANRRQLVTVEKGQREAEDTREEHAEYGRPLATNGPTKTSAESF